MAVVKLNTVTGPDCPPRWEAQVTAFLRAKRAAKTSPSTLTLYEGSLRGPRAVEWLLRNEVTQAADLTPVALRDLQLTLADSGLSENTVRSYHRILKTFARWCDEEGFGAADAKMLKVKAPRSSVVKPSVFSDAEIARLMAAATHPRDVFLMEFLLHTGARLSEVTGRYEDGKWVPGVCLDSFHESAEYGPWFHVHGKGRKDRLIPLDTPKYKLSKKLAAYLRHVRPRDTERRELFLSTRRQDGDYLPLTADAVKQVLSRLGEMAQVPHTHAHRFRHTFATRAVEAGVNVLALQRVLGHTTLAMTQRYTQFDASSLLAEWGHRRD